MFWGRPLLGRMDGMRDAGWGGREGSGGRKLVGRFGGDSSAKGIVCFPGDDDDDDDAVTDEDERSSPTSVGA